MFFFLILGLIFLIINEVKKNSRSLAKVIAVICFLSICANMGYDIYDNHNKKITEINFLKEKIYLKKETIAKNKKLFQEDKNIISEITYIPKNLQVNNLVITEEILVD